MKIKNIYTYVIFILINAFSLYAQEQANPVIEIFSSLGAMETYIGQHINYRVTIKSIKNIQYGFNEIIFPYSNDEFQVISLDTEKIDDDEYTKTIYNYKIAFYNHGIYNMPDCSIEYISNNTSIILSSTPIYISIKPLSDGEYLPPIQNNQDITFPWFMLTIIILSIIFVIALVIYILYILQKKKNTKNTVVILPEDVQALKELRELEIKITWKEITFTEYYFELTQIFRKYLTTRFELPILEMTTDEIRRHVPSKILPKYDTILEFLNYSDFIKFSRLEVNVKNSISNMRFCEMYIKEYGSKDNAESIKQENSKHKEKYNENKRNNKARDI